MKCLYLFFLCCLAKCVDKNSDFDWIFVVGPETVPAELLKVALAPTAVVGESHQYPPVNWASILSPLMRLNFGKINSFLLSRLYLSQDFFTNAAFTNFRSHFKAWSYCSGIYYFQNLFFMFPSIYLWSLYHVGTVFFSTQEEPREYQTWEVWISTRSFLKHW